MAEMSECVATVRVERDADRSGDVVFVSTGPRRLDRRPERRRLGQAGAYSHEALKRGFS